MRHPLAVGALVIATAGAACDAAPTPTAPSTSVAPFIVGSPTPYPGADAPGVFGVWTGTMQFTDCRAAPPSVCKVAPGPRAIRLVMEQQGNTVTGRFSMNEPGGPAWPFVGYVTSGGGIAGTATVDEGTRVLVRLAAPDNQRAGEVSDEARTDGRLTFVRHFVVPTPLARVSSLQ